MTVLETITMLNSKIYNFFKESGIGSTHVMTKTGNYMLKRWGVWTPLFSILFSKVYPIKQIAHNHEGNFISFILWGNYVEEVDGVDTNKKWINILNYKKFHKIKASKPVYTLMFMGKRINSETSAIVNGRIIPSSKIVRGYR